MAIDPEMKHWPSKQLHDRFDILEDLIAQHVVGEKSKAQVKRHNKQIKERNHIGAILAEQKHTNPDSSRAKYERMQLKPLPEALKQEVITQPEFKLPKKVSRHTALLAESEKLPESEDHHDKYYNTNKSSEEDQDQGAVLHDDDSTVLEVARTETRAASKKKSGFRHTKRGIKKSKKRLLPNDAESSHNIDSEDAILTHPISATNLLEATNTTPIHSEHTQSAIPQGLEPNMLPPVMQPFSNAASTVAHTPERSVNNRFGGRRDEITFPSSASGGVPDPSPFYLLQAQVPPRTLPTLQPILVVIDLNGTILFRGGRSSTSFVERPFARQFLNYMFSNFIVMIWSSARPENTSAMCERILTPLQQQRVVGIWGRDRFGLTPSDYTKRVQVYKRLARIWSDAAILPTHPFTASGQTWCSKNTILIDDSFEKARSEPFNLVPVPEFVGQTEDPDILRKVAEYLDVIKFQDNVSSYMKLNPFDVSKIEVKRSPEELAGMEMASY